MVSRPCGCAARLLLAWSTLCVGAPAQHGRLVLQHGATFALRTNAGQYLRANGHLDSNGVNAKPPYFWQQFTVLPVKGVTIKHNNMLVRYGDRVSLRNTDQQWIEASSHSWQRWQWGSKKVFDDWTEDFTITWMGAAKGWVHDGDMVGFRARNGMWLQAGFHNKKGHLSPTEFSQQKPWQTFTLVCVRGCSYPNVVTPAPTPLPTPSPAHAILAPATLCGLSKWGPWGSCTHTCGGGQTTRHRHDAGGRSQEVAAILGRACPALTQSMPCNQFSCHDSPKHHNVCGASVGCRLATVDGRLVPRIVHYGATPARVADAKHWQCEVHNAVKAQPLQHVRKVRMVSPCAVLQHYFGGRCTNIRRRGAAHTLHGFKLSSPRSGLRFREKSFDPAHVEPGSNNVRNACLLALYGSRGAFKWHPSKQSFAVARGRRAPFWYGGCAKGDACARCMNAALMKPHRAFDFSTGGSCTGNNDEAASWSTLSCVWEESSPFEFVGSEGETHTLGVKATCSCKCKTLPCCSKEGFTLLNPPLRGSVFRNDRTKEDCCERCKQHPHCTSWTFGGGQWARKERPTCQLFSGAPTYTRFTPANALERTKFAGAPPGPYCDAA